MITKELSAAVRNSFGKGSMRQLRSQGKTPAVVYGGGKDALALEFETKVLYNNLIELQGRNAIITLDIAEAGKKTVIVKELQTDPVNDSLRHADFLEIDLESSATFTVPITFVGKAKGVDLGGILQVSQSEILLQGKPLSIPDDCPVDISNLAIGDSVNLASIGLPDGVALLSDPDSVCVSVNKPL